MGDIDGDLDINLEAPSAFAVAAPTKSIGDPSIPSITLTVNEGKKISGHCAINIKPESTVGNCSLNIDKAAVIEDYCTVTVGGRIEEACSLVINGTVECTTGGYNVGAGVYVSGGYIGGDCSIVIESGTVTGKGSSLSQETSVAGIGIAVDNSGSISGDCSIAIDNSEATGDGSGGGGGDNDYNSIAGIGIAVDNSGSISGDCSIAINNNSEAKGDGSGGGGGGANDVNSVAGIGIAVDNSGSISGDCSIAIDNSEATGDGSGGGGDNNRFNSVAGIGIAVDSSGSISGDCSIAIDNSEAKGDGSGGGGDANDANSVAGIGIAVDWEGSISGDCSIAIDNSEATGDGSGGGGDNNWFNSVAGIGIAVDNGGSIGGVCSIAIDSKGVATVNAQGSDSSNSVASFGAALNYGGKINANLSIAIDGSTVCGDVAVAATNDSAITGTITASGSGCVSGSVTLPTGVTGNPVWISGNQTCTACSAPSLSTSVVKPANPEMAATVAGTTESEAAAPKAALQQPPDAGGTRSARINRTHQQSKPTQQPTVTLRSGAIKQAAVLKAAFDVVSSATCPPLFIKVDNLDVSCPPPVIVNAVTACGYDACTGTFNAPQVLGFSFALTSSSSTQPTLPRVALDDNGHGIVVWQRQDEMLVSHAYACPYDYDVATGDFGLTFTLANGSQAFTPDADLGGCGCGIIAWAQTSTADDKHTDIWACTYNPVTKELGTAAARF